MGKEGEDGGDPDRGREVNHMYIFYAPIYIKPSILFDVGIHSKTIFSYDARIHRDSLYPSQRLRRRVSPPRQLSSIAGGLRLCLLPRLRFRLLWPRPTRSASPIADPLLLLASPPWSSPPLREIQPPPWRSPPAACSRRLRLLRLRVPYRRGQRGRLSLFANVAPPLARSNDVLSDEAGPRICGGSAVTAPALAAHDDGTPARRARRLEGRAAGRSKSSRT